MWQALLVVHAVHGGLAMGSCPVRVAGCAQLSTPQSCAEILGAGERPLALSAQVITWLRPQIVRELLKKGFAVYSSGASAVVCLSRSLALWAGA